MNKRRGIKTVLVIEDEMDILKLTSRILELEGYRVLEAKNGEEGMRLLRASPICLVLLDLRLPDCDGWAVLEQIKEDSALSVIPVVVFTASAGVPQRERALDMGAADYLVKPLSAASLRKAVARILG